MRRKKPIARLCPAAREIVDILDNEPNGHLAEAIRKILGESGVSRYRRGKLTEPALATAVELHRVSDGRVSVFGWNTKRKAA